MHEENKLPRILIAWLNSRDYCRLESKCKLCCTVCPHWQVVQRLHSSLIIILIITDAKVAHTITGRHVLLIHIPCGCSALLLQYVDMQLWWTGNSKSPQGVNLSVYMLAVLSGDLFNDCIVSCLNIKTKWPRLYPWCFRQMQYIFHCCSVLT